MYLLCLKNELKNVVCVKHSQKPSDQSQHLQND